MSLNAEQRRALELLASGRHGANEELLVLGRGFSRMLAGLVRAGLAAAEREVVKAGGKTIEVVRGKYPPAKPGALMSEPLKAAWRGR